MAIQCSSCINLRLMHKASSVLFKYTCKRSTGTAILRQNVLGKVANQFNKYRVLFTTQFPRAKWVFLGVGSSGILVSHFYWRKKCVAYSESDSEFAFVRDDLSTTYEHDEAQYTVIGNLRLILRALRIAVTFTPLILCYPLTFVSHSLTELWWNAVLLAFDSLGPTFIKLGQWTSTRRDLFSREFCDLFARLHSKAKMHSWKVTERLMNEQFGPNWPEIFVHMDKEPIGSGCIAQVYRAYVRTDKLTKNGISLKNIQTSSADSGMYRQVAVKVVHPGVYESVQRDLQILHLLSRCVERVFHRVSWLSMSQCIGQFTEVMLRQIDLTCEADSLIQFNKNFASVPYIKFPQPMRKLCSPRILVETLEEGTPISNYVQNDAMGGEDIRKQLAHLGVDALLKMVFVDNLVHGDLHPGNILVQKCPPRPVVHSNSKGLFKRLREMADNAVALVSPPLPLRLVLLDCGICKSLSEHDLTNLRRVFKAIVLGQGAEVAELMLAHARQSECSDVSGFKDELGALVLQARRHALTLARVQVGELLSQVFGVLMKYQVKMESNFASVMLAMFVLEGLGRSLDPELNILERARPVLLSLRS